MTNQELKEKMMELKYAIIDCENRLIIKKSEEKKIWSIVIFTWRGYRKEMGRYTIRSKMVKNWNKRL